MIETMTENKSESTEKKPLSLFKGGSVIQVSEIEGGKTARKKLFDLGILPGAKLEVVQGSPGFPFILRVGDSRIMLGWGMVQKILVNSPR
jgi:ferrous iron transport protein A